MIPRTRSPSGPATCTAAPPNRPSPTRSYPYAAVLTGAGAVTAAGHPVIHGAATLAGAGTVAAVGYDGSLTFTVTATQGGATAAGMFLYVKVLTSAAATQNGATATQAGTAAHQAAITTTITGSQVYGAVLDVSSTVLTANAATTMSGTNTYGGLSFGSCRSTTATGTPGAKTVGCSAPADAGLCALAEILPAGTITEDASSPAPAGR